jgi:hypothetical protein
LILPQADIKSPLQQGSSYYIPANAKHSAIIKSNDGDITLFDQKNRYKEKLTHWNFVVNVNRIVIPGVDKSSLCNYNNLCDVG